jgi:hypothetical protein
MRTRQASCAIVRARALPVWPPPDTVLLRGVEVLGQEDTRLDDYVGNGVGGTLMHESYPGVGSVVSRGLQLKETKGGFACRFTKSAPIR